MKVLRTKVHGGCDPVGKRRLLDIPVRRQKAVICHLTVAHSAHQWADVSVALREARLIRLPERVVSRYLNADLLREQIKPMTMTT